ncbi:MAG: cell wall hydrolase [Lachnospiraceae bacterium]|nr:cell wall hydrolase [Lachnospiraceae bacterium]
MSIKKMVVCMMVVCVLAGSIFSAKPSQAAEREYTNRDVKLLSAIIFCEAGNQSYAGKLAVGCVVMNRKRSSRFPNSVEKVIRQKRQFSPVASGKFKKELERYNNGSYEKGVRAECVRAAKAALSGQDYVKTRGKKVNMRRYHFFSGHLSRAKLRIGAHDFK